MLFWVIVQNCFVNNQIMIYSKSPQELHLFWFVMILLFLDINVSYYLQTLFNRFHKILLICFVIYSSSITPKHLIIRKAFKTWFYWHISSMTGGRAWTKQGNMWFKSHAPSSLKADSSRALSQCLWMAHMRFGVS